MTDWQERTMTGAQYKRAIRQLGMSQLGSGRFLGVSERTPRRYVTGEMTIHPPTAMLLRLMLETGQKPIVPKREAKKRRQR